MSAPERIWAYTNDGYGERMTDHGTWDTGIEGQPYCHPEWAHAPYILADLCDPMQDERVKALVAAAKAVDRYCHWFREGDELRAALRALDMDK